MGQSVVCSRVSSPSPVALRIPTFSFYVIDIFTISGGVLVEQGKTLLQMEGGRQNKTSFSYPGSINLAYGSCHCPCRRSMEGHQLLGRRVVLSYWPIPGWEGGCFGPSPKDSSLSSWLSKPRVQEPVEISFLFFFLTIGNRIFLIRHKSIIQLSENWQTYSQEDTLLRKLGTVCMYFCSHCLYF